MDYGREHAAGYRLQRGLHRLVEVHEQPGARALLPHARLLRHRAAEAGLREPVVRDDGHGVADEAHVRIHL